MKFVKGKNKYNILGLEISYMYSAECKYLNISDIACMKESKSNKDSIVQNWLKSKNTVNLIANAEKIQYGTTSIEYKEPFSMDIYKDGKSIITKRGRSGGIYAQEWIVSKFLEHLFPEKGYLIGQLFGDECKKAQKRIELTRIREQVKSLLSEVKPDANFFHMTNIHEIVNIEITGHKAKAFAASIGEEAGYCPSNDFSLDQLNEAIDIYKMAIKKLKSGEYHSKEMLIAHRSRKSDLMALSL